MDEQESIKINVGEIKKGLNKTFDFLKQKKVLNVLIIVLFLALLIGSSWIRLQNLPLLKDSTTGEYIPLALDPFYFLRVAETMIGEGGLPEYDAMRYPSAKIGFTNELTPKAVIFLYQMSKIIDKDVTIQFIDVISPVIFFVLGLIAFFFLVYVLTNSKMTALISSAFLAVIPTYLYRTMTGFSDHESIGMFALFAVFLCYSLALKFLNKENTKKNPLIKAGLWGLLVGFLSVFAITSWGGGAKFIFMIIPISFGLFWLIKTKVLTQENKPLLLNFLVFYIFWFISTILFGMIYGFSFSSIIVSVALGGNSLANSAVLLFLIIDFMLIKLKDKYGFLKEEKMQKYRILYSALITAIIGFLFITFYFNKGVISYIIDIGKNLLQPFGTGRTGSTVAENAIPNLQNWIGQVGKIFFWLFYLGMVFVGINLSKGIGKKKNKILFSLLWIAMISGILFSRISPSSLFNGNNFISKFIYFAGPLLFLAYCVWVYFKDEIKLKPVLLIISVWLIFMLIAGRGAVRFFFLITPFVSFMAGYFIVELFNYAKKNKDDILKMITWVVIVLVLFGAIFSFNNFTQSSLVQAKSTGPSANFQWQNAMKWVRDNTQEMSIFVHWWDYGYWVQYLGERPSIADGGHGVPFWDHLIGRYILTTPNPNTALSFMKTHNVSYLLMDPTDLGKYGAYSKIGSGKEGIDRYSWIPVMTLDQRQTIETSEGKMMVYIGGTPLDEDIIYEFEGNQVFLPSNNAGIGGIILEMVQGEETITFKQPEGIFGYNQKQIRIPLRYVYFNNEIVDFGTGLDAIIRIVPLVYQTDQGIQIENFGTLIYLSPKNMKTLFARLYLMNDPFNQYETIQLVHSEQDPNVNILNLQGANLNDIVYFQGFRGPIKIWKVEYSENILTKEEFLRTSGEYAEFDNLEFAK